MMTKQKISTGLVVALLVAATAACGVKSSPTFPKDSTFPNVYPASGKLTTGTSSTEKPTATTTGTYTRQTTPRSSGTYTPPPPATELLIK